MVAEVTHPLPIRREEPPDETIIAARGGALDAQTVGRSAVRSFNRDAVYGISVEGVLTGTVLEACQASDRLAV